MICGGPLLEHGLDEDGHVAVRRTEAANDGEAEVVLAPLNKILLLFVKHLQHLQVLLFLVQSYLKGVGGGNPADLRQEFPLPIVY